MVVTARDDAGRFGCCYAEQCCMDGHKPIRRKQSRSTRSSRLKQLLLFSLRSSRSPTRFCFAPSRSGTENGKKRSRVDYRNTCYHRALPNLLKQTVLQLLRVADQERLNIFFGVCPRAGNKGRFDLAWQIQTVRALWTDIDHITVAEARNRVEKTGLPAPSIFVNSGNGVHLYWLLDQPYQIDDAGVPPPVETEWLQSPDGRKKPRKYIVENGDKGLSRSAASRLPAQP